MTNRARLPEGTRCGVHGELLTERDDGTFRCTGCDADPRREEPGDFIGWSMTPGLAGTHTALLRVTIGTERLLAPLPNERRLEASQSLARMARALHPDHLLDPGDIPPCGHQWPCNEDECVAPPPTHTVQVEVGTSEGLTVTRFVVGEQATLETPLMFIGPMLLRVTNIGRR